MPKAAFRVKCDFNQDGDFTDANEDITADIRTTGRGMEIIRGKKFPTQRAEAAILQLFLKNDDHKYSPSKTTSVLYPLVFPGPDIWVQMAYPMDDFIADDGTTLNSRKPSHDSLFAAWEGDTGDFDVLSNKIRTPSLPTDDFSAVLDFGETDCFVAVDFTYGAAGLPVGPVSLRSGLALRWSDANNTLTVFAASNNPNAELYINKIDGGTFSGLHGPIPIKDADGNEFGWTAGEEHRLSVEMHGNDLLVSVDDIYQFTYTTTFNNTATKHGIIASPHSSADRWDNFGGWRSVFFGRIDTIKPRPETERQYVYIRAFDDMERMSQHQVYRTAPTGSVSTNADDILGVILDGVDASSQNRILDTGKNLSQDAKHEKALDDDGLTEVYQLQDDDVGFFRVDGSGFYRYEDSDHRDSAPHTIARATWREDRLAGDETDIELSGELLDWDDGKENVENEVYYEFHRISRTTAVLVWRLELDDKPKVLNLGTIDILAVGDGDHIANPITPVHTTDFTFNTAEGGGGTDLLIAEDSEQGTVSASGSAAFTLDDATQDFTDWNDGKHQVRITDAGGDTALAFLGTDDLDGDGTKITLYTTSALADKGYVDKTAAFSESDTPLTYNVYNVTMELVVGFDGNHRRISLRNGSGSDGFVTFLRLRADKGVKSSKTAARAEDTTSQTDVGRRRKQHVTKHIDRFGDVGATGLPTDSGSALDRATARLDARKDRKEIIRAVMPNTTRANLMQLVHRSISDRINLVFTKMGINDSYFIEGLKLSVREGGLLVSGEWTLQQAVTGSWGFQRWGFFYWV